MRFNLHQLHEIARAAGVPDPKGLPLSAVVAAIALEESDGNPLSSGDKGTSFGIVQVHEPDWPEVAILTRGVMMAPLTSDYGRAVAEIRLAKPILEKVARDAVEAARALEKRGFAVSPVDMMLMIDAGWQGPGLMTWATETTTGDIAEVRERTAPGRTARVRAHLAELGIGDKWSWGTVLLTVLGLGGVGALVLWALSEWEG